ncbi:MAG: agmatinase [archaeon]|nr:agmatinase [archaeon]
MVSHPKNFGGLPKMFSRYKESKIAIIPVPYDGTSTWGKGADKGPWALFEASANMELYDIETDSEVYQKGIFTDKPVSEKKSPEKMVAAVEKRVAGHLKEGKFTVVIGGEHSVSPGAVAAHAKAFKNLSVLQIDAHSDLRPQYEGTKNNHACAMSRIKEMCPIVQVGIRSMCVEEKAHMDTSRVFFAHQIHASKTWQEDAIAKLTDNVYITFDLDAFDSALMPSTGTPEPGGLDWNQVSTFLAKVFAQKNVVGFDVVELAPSKSNKAPDFVAAKLVYMMLSRKFAK